MIYYGKYNTKVLLKFNHPENNSDLINRLLPSFEKELTNVKRLKKRIRNSEKRKELLYYKKTLENIVSILEIVKTDFKNDIPDVASIVYYKTSKYSYYYFIEKIRRNGRGSFVYYSNLFTFVSEILKNMSSDDSESRNSCIEGQIYRLSCNLLSDYYSSADKEQIYELKKIVEKIHCLENRDIRHGRKLRKILFQFFRHFSLFSKLNTNSENKNPPEIIFDTIEKLRKVIEEEKDYKLKSNNCYYMKATTKSRILKFLEILALLESLDRISGLKILHNEIEKTFGSKEENYRISSSDYIRKMNLFLYFYFDNREEAYRFICQFREMFSLEEIEYSDMKRNEIEKLLKNNSTDCIKITKEIRNVLFLRRYKYKAMFDAYFPDREKVTQKAKQFVNIMGLEDCIIKKNRYSVNVFFNVSNEKRREVFYENATLLTMAKEAIPTRLVERIKYDCRK